MSTTNNQTERKETDYSKLDAVNLSFRRPAKWYMYVVKRVLKEKNTVDIKARPSAAAQVVRVAEALKRLGYVTYTKYYTTSIVTDQSLQRFIVVTVQKTKDFDRLYDEREVERTKKLEEQGKTNTTTTTTKA
jgi:hypothetical protein